LGWSRGPRFGPPLSALSSTVHLSLSLSLSPSFCLSLSPSSSKPRRVRRAHTHELQLHRARAGAQLGVAPAHQTIPAHFALLLASTERARTRLQSSPLTLSLVGSPGHVMPGGSSILARGPNREEHRALSLSRAVEPFTSEGHMRKPARFCRTSPSHYRDTGMAASAKAPCYTRPLAA
jgi:hypothetical protein